MEKHYQDMDIRELLKTTALEEEELRFSDFSNNDAYALGKCIIDNFEEYGVASIEIFINGYCRFSFFPDGTSPNNGLFLTKKRRTVEIKEWSSLHMFAWLERTGKTAEYMNMPPEEFCIIGGSFPIRLKGGSVIGSVTVSGMPHFDDHRLIIASLRDFLKGK